MVCSGDSTELCGAGNRIALYQNTAASPPNPNSCLPAANNQGQRNYQNTGIVAVDINNGEDPLEIWGATPDVTHGDTGPEFTLLSVSSSSIRKNCPLFRKQNCENCPFEDVNNFELNADRFFAYAVNGLAIPPRVGESPLFEEFGTEAPYTGYCAQVSQRYTDARQINLQGRYSQIQSQLQVRLSDFQYFRQVGMQIYGHFAWTAQPEDASMLSIRPLMVIQTMISQTAEMFSYYWRQPTHCRYLAEKMYQRAFLFAFTRLMRIFLLISVDQIERTLWYLYLQWLNKFDALYYLIPVLQLIRIICPPFCKKKNNKIIGFQLVTEGREPLRNAWSLGPLLFLVYHSNS